MHREHTRPHLPSVQLETRSLNVDYNGTTVLRDVSLALQRGQITAIIGPSGCGKTSFLQALNRISDLIPGCRVTGDVLLDGKSIYDSRADVIAVRRRVGMIFQKPNPFPLSVRRNIELPLIEHGVKNREERRKIVQRVLQDVGLWDEVQDRLESSSLALSGGQQQRLCIARALALDPEVLLFDEPCSALDPIASRTVEQLIRSLAGRTTIAIVTHNLAQANRIADRVAMFWYQANAGCMIEVGSRDRLLNNPRDPVTAAYVRGAEG